ncbi:pilus assembly protein N-terminal domain-containing protein [Methylobacterium nodulans]|uniref:Pilus formation protein N-terminal domain-containing protein n=1 Tax=Methylobacterium nodulans (strain LMG 21967 / CNCM I-2342 / ORS 2060) TaxID=460265 RepID=B8IRG1_METNO|nr:pilus assembly protein N-terminal domain-containing protein [Methylobacterium nodulans]ACL58701.1 conserved hypothetical protein [Methylobacterium nodulans ORS 2060]
MRAFAIIPLLAIVTSASAADSLALRPGQVEIVKTSRGARTVVVGDPDIADVTVANESTIVVTAKENGVTDLVLLDESGREFLRKQLQIGSPELTVRVYRTARETTEAVCTASSCMPLPKLAGATRRAAIGQAKVRPSETTEAKEAVTTPPE